MPVPLLRQPFRAMLCTIRSGISGSSVSWPVVEWGSFTRPCSCRWRACSKFPLQRRSTRQLQRCKTEARAALLHHPNIVPVYAVGCERGVHLHAMQLIEGQSLARAIVQLRRQADCRRPTMQRRACGCFVLGKTVADLATGSSTAAGIVGSRRAIAPS